MILFLSDGRLGNQLFQYAFLNTIVKENEKIIALNMEYFIDKFDVPNPSFKHVKTSKYSRFIIRKLVEPFLLFLIRFKLFGSIEQQKSDTNSLSSYIEKKGIFPIRLVFTNFFQSEIFFNSSSVDFELKADYLMNAKHILDDISNDYIKVFIHVRRGDYIYVKYLNELGIDLPKQYFLDAIDKIKNEIENPFFIFLSDDPTYIECCFKEIENKYISRNSMAVDLALMSLCEFGIVSNSSFSWWGAYLMKNRKKVIFPKYWYGWKNKIESHENIQPSWAEIIEVRR